MERCAQKEWSVLQAVLEGKSIIKTENDNSRPCLALSLAVGHRYVVTFDSPTGPDI